MTDLVSAAKTLKALGDDGNALRCVEADPTEVQRMALKKVGKAAGPVAVSYTHLTLPTKRIV